MENDFQETKNLRILAVVGIAFFAIAIVFMSVIAAMIGATDYKVDVENKDFTEDILSTKDRERMERNLRTVLKAYYTIDDGTRIESTIRRATYTEKTVGNGQQLEFIIDIPTVEVSYLVWMVKDSDSDYDISFSCTKPELSLYPDKFCMSMSTSTDVFSTINVTLDEYLPYNGVTKSGYHYSLSHRPTEAALWAYVNSCGDEKMVREVRESVEEWIRDKGYNPDIYPLDIPINNCYDSSV